MSRDRIDTGPAEGGALHRRVRRLRKRAGLAAKELAAKIGISPSYLSLIEQGRRVPTEDVAARLASALGDDPELYRAWALASRQRDYDGYMTRMLRYDRLRTDPGLRNRLADGEELDTLEAGDVDRAPIDDGPGPRNRYADRPGERLESASSRARRRARAAGVGPTKAEGRGLRGRAIELFGGVLRNAVSAGRRDDGESFLRVPVLHDGVDPDEPDAAGPDGIDEVLRFDPRTLPATDATLVAYRPGRAMLELAGPSIRSGDLVLVALEAIPVGETSMALVRFSGRPTFGRVERAGNEYRLLWPESTDHAMRWDIRLEPAPLIGVVLSIVRGRAAEQDARPDPPRGTAEQRLLTIPEATTPAGRSYELRDDLLIRDCEWRDNYGWRPIQQAEDLDFLEEHPRMRIRYRLIRDGRVRYLLEMTPDQWRGALGSYVDGPTWRRNGYIVAVTKRREGRYTERFQDRWAPYVRRATD